MKFNFWRDILISGLLLVSGCASSPPPPSTMPQVEIDRYMGTWYEIAAFPMYFEKGCTCTQAHYTLKNNYVEVVNQCRRGSTTAAISSAEGKAWPLKNANNSKLEVSFYWPFKADYWILYVDPAYQYALVGNPHRSYLWVLARQPVISPATYRRLLVIAQQKGYDIHQLVKTQQQGCAFNFN